MQGRKLARRHTPFGDEVEELLFSRKAFHDGTFLQAWMLSANCCLLPCEPLVVPFPISFHLQSFSCGR